jgi:predicted metalloprotease
MKMDDLPESQNIEDRRGGGGGNDGSVGGGGGGGLPFGRGGLGLGGLLIVLVISYFTGINPMTLIGGYDSVTGNGQQQTQQAQPQAGQPTSQGAPADAGGTFVARVLGSTEETWSRILPQQANGLAYVKPHLVLYARYTQSGCGAAQSAMGPFYCPNDRLVYLDTEFFQEMRNRFDACPATGACTFAQAYVIAHEVGHHVQNLLGILPKVHALQEQAGDQAQANALSVKLELQADCFAGVWANQANAQHHFMEPGDIEAAMQTASAIGDDRLQKRAQGYVVPDSFTHGSSAQRQHWFTAGFQTGQLTSCNTFQAAN